jgi:hypothetical protein
MPDGRLTQPDLGSPIGSLDWNNFRLVVKRMNTQRRAQSVGKQ